MCLISADIKPKKTTRKKKIQDSKGERRLHVDRLLAVVCGIQQTQSDSVDAKIRDFYAIVASRFFLQTVPTLL